MSETTQPGRIGADKILLGVVIAVVVGMLLFVGSTRQTGLRNSPAGLEGLRIWLTDQGQEAQSFAGGWPLVAEEIGLLVVPLFDTAINRDRTRPTTREDLLMQQDEYDLRSPALFEKARMVPTLIVLPKWRSGMRLTGIAHPVLLSSPERIAAVGDLFTGGSGFDLQYGASPFTELDYEASDGARLTATLYAAQTFVAPGCRPVIGTATGEMLLGDCPLPGRADRERVYILSDPDLLNNHGLALGDNAFIARDFMTDLAGGLRVVIDYSDRNWLTEDVWQSERERSWSDLMRFFSPPFTLLWLGGALTLALVLWRAGWRFGPVLAGPRRGSASKTLAIAARARLMLLSGHPGALASDYMRARLAATATTLFGHAHGRRMGTPEAFLDYTQRRHPDHAGPLAGALNAITALPDGTTGRHAMATIDDLDRILEKITHDA